MIHVHQQHANVNRSLLTLTLTSFRALHTYLSSTNAVVIALEVAQILYKVYIQQKCDSVCLWMSCKSNPPRTNKTNESHFGIIDNKKTLVKSIQAKLTSSVLYYCNSELEATKCTALDGGDLAGQHAHTHPLK